MDKLKLNSYTDESGQDTKGKTFVVCTIIVLSDKVDEIEDELLKIEADSGKNKKWYRSGDKRRHEYIKLVLQNKILRDIDIFYSEYKNKMDYTSLVASHIAKAILTFTQNKQYISKIFIDKMDKRTLFNITREIKSFRIRYKKIRGLTEESNACIRFVDALCGLIRDMKNKNIPNNYRILFSKMKVV